MSADRRTPRAVLFDLDGTLVDSAPDLVDALNRVRESEGLEPVAVHEAAHGVTRGAVGLLNVGMPRTDEATFESWRRDLVAHYAACGFHRSRLYPGIPELL
jgi:phosphoglycolate phosphatase